MRDPFFIIIQRVEEFGNHFQKYLVLIEQHKESLTYDLEGKGVLDNVQLYNPAIDLAYEMDTILNVTDDRTKQLDYLATYYALQFIILNIRCLDIMRMSLLSGKPNLVTYKNYMKQMGKGFRKLSGCYMEKVLSLHFSNEQLGEYVVLGVGTIADQDDIDIGIIDSGDKYREKLNLGIGSVAQEMLKRACYLHFHISEHVGTQSHSASIQEYLHLLDTEIHDFVIINEMLNAWPIFGSWELFRTFQKQVIQRYYYRQDEKQPFHEGFLRGILGEIISLRAITLKDDRLHPKEDALRMIKGMMSVSKTILNIEQIGSWDVISLLKNKSVSWRKQFQMLEESLIFIETFRFFYQLFICQSEDIYLLDRNDWKNLNIVAKNMGYRDLGVIKAWNHLLIAYYQYVEQANNAIDELLPWIQEHLTRHSLLSEKIATFTDRSAAQNQDQKVAHPESVREAGSFAVEFTKQIQFFRGTQFWDDILDSFFAQDGNVMRLFVKDLQKQSNQLQNKLINNYATCTAYTTRSIITVMNFLAEKIHSWDCQDLFSKFFSAFLHVLKRLPNADERLARIVNYQPTLINDFFRIIPEEFVEPLVAILRSKHWDDRIEYAKNRLIKLLYLHKISSRHFYRFLDLMIQQNPGLIKFLDKSEKINMMSMGILGKVEETVSFQEKKDQLGHYYDLEYVRVGILTLLGENINVTNVQYTEFVDNYLQMLFTICKQEVDFKMGKRTFTKDLLAVFSAGGHAREQAFDNDYDIIVLLNSDDQAILDYSMKIISKMNSEIIKRGTLPHFRFADHFGKYVTTFQELQNYLAQETEELFIDKSQLLGSRRVVGSKIFSGHFIRDIIGPYIYNKNHKFILDMAREYSLRHEDPEENDHMLDVKDCKGGLRDIEMLLMVYKAYFKIRKNISTTLFDMLIAADPGNERDIKRLQRTYRILSHIRDFYRLTVAANDDVVWEEMAEPLNMLLSANIRYPWQDIDKVKTRALNSTKRASQIIDRLMQEFTQKVNTHEN